MGHARGVICLAAAQAGIPVQHYAATRIKSILSGSGHAPKTQVQESVKRELGLDAIPQPSDVSDALAIALCHSYLSKNQQNLSQLHQSRNGFVMP
jgi:crossover junction endodeoxyribonuclease RuvC